MKVKSVLKNPDMTQRAFEYIYSKWGNKDSFDMYRDNIYNCSKPFPNWYLLMENDKIYGCAGLISNDFISRSDLYPWICALFVDEQQRGKGYGNLLMEKIRKDAFTLGFEKVYLCTDHKGYYEKYGFRYIGQGYHPWGESSGIYEGLTYTENISEENENIRRAVPADKKTIAGFNRDLAAETEGKKLEMDVLEEGVKKVLQDPSRGEYYLYCINQEIAGQLMITKEWSDWRNGYFWWIQSVYVVPEKRGKGIYKKLYEYVETLCNKDPEAVGLRLYVEKENESARRVYEMTGMKKTSYLLYGKEK